MCNLFLNMCIVGLVQTGPNVYEMQTLTDSGVIRSFTVYEGDYWHHSGHFLSNRSSSPKLPPS
jgi:hypothetical protein